LEQAVYSRLQNHQRIGVQLSGGMDSSAIAVIASGQMDKRLLFSYSFVLNEQAKSELPHLVDEQLTQRAIIEHAGLFAENHRTIDGFHYTDVFEELEQSRKIMKRMG